MDKVSYTKTITHYLLGKKIWSTVENFIQVDDENFEQPKIQKVYITEEYYNDEFNIENKEE